MSRAFVVIWLIVVAGIFVSMIVLGAMPNGITVAAIALAFLAAALLAIEPEEKLIEQPV